MEFGHWTQDSSKSFLSVWEKQEQIDMYKWRGRKTPNVLWQKQKCRKGKQKSKQI